MNLLRKPLLWILLGMAVLCSCSEDEPEQDDTKHIMPEMMVIFSPDGLGDGCYNDQILRGIELMLNEHEQDVNIMFITPNDLEDVAFLTQYWLETLDEPSDEEGNIPRKLLILASSEYADIARGLLGDTQLDINRSILAFEAQDNGDETEQIRTFDFSMYGASWLAGRTAQLLGCQKPLVLLGNGDNATTFDGRDGFVDGFKLAAGENATVDVGAIAMDWRGYGMPTETYQKMYEYDGKYDFIYSISGGSNMGIYRYLREFPECGIYTAGMDIDQSPYSTLIVGSMVKRIDLVLHDYLLNWYNKVEVPRYQHFGMESGYIDWQIADRYSKELKEQVDALRQEAIKKEKEHANDQK